MNALKWILFGVVLALFALFTFSNSVRVPIVLPDGATVLIYLPVVVFVAFLVGWLPMLLLHVAGKATWRRRLAKTDRLLEEALSTGPRVAPSPAASPASAPLAPSPTKPPVATPSPLSPIAAQGQPTVVPPAGA